MKINGKKKFLPWKSLAWGEMKPLSCVEVVSIDSPGEGLYGTWSLSEWAHNEIVSWWPLGTASGPGRRCAMWISWEDWVYCFEFGSHCNKWQRRWTFKLCRHLPITSVNSSSVPFQPTEVLCSSCVLGSSQCRSQPVSSLYHRRPPGQGPWRTAPPSLQGLLPLLHPTDTCVLSILILEGDSVIWSSFPFYLHFLLIQDWYITLLRDYDLIQKVKVS